VEPSQVRAIADAVQKMRSFMDGKRTLEVRVAERRLCVSSLVPLTTSARLLHVCRRCWPCLRAKWTARARSMSLGFTRSLGFTPGRAGLRYAGANVATSPSLQTDALLIASVQLAAAINRLRTATMTQ
jgi:hypothetical protein